MVHSETKEMVHAPFIYQSFLNVFQQLYGRKASWEDPAEWVIDSYPWMASSSQDWPSLLRLRPEDVGFDGYSMHSGIKGSTQGQQGQGEVEGDPLVSKIIFWIYLELVLGSCEINLIWYDDVKDVENQMKI